MIASVITPADANGSIYRFLLSEGAEKVSQLAFFPLDCCDYSFYQDTLPPLFEEDDLWEE